ncbi:hypothetical protein SCHPADRAFT_943701 [Schizopora paradoxa]|uniref:Uncharacterized protein n=1 Tax=Schizopora paradoxa TaxID=27342 RepID=A0A0H2RX17_9AGAM|nr:hypothetical protein SCHPADRAFT_943701 [Schizopora paradoxa]
MPRWNVDDARGNSPRCGTTDFRLLACVYMITSFDGHRGFKLKHELSVQLVKCPIPAATLQLLSSSNGINAIHESRTQSSSPPSLKRESHASVVHNGRVPKDRAAFLEHVWVGGWLTLPTSAAFASYATRLLHLSDLKRNRSGSNHEVAIS